MKPILILSFALLTLFAVLTVAGQPAGATPLREAPSSPVLPSGGTATPTSCPITYAYELAGATVLTTSNRLPGSTCSRCIVPITLPFPFTFYGQTYTTANLSTIGNMQFATAVDINQSCPFPFPALGPSMYPYWNSSLDTSWDYPCQGAYNAPCGIFTAVNGTAPYRTFDIEWRARFLGSNHETVDFAIRLYENSENYDFIYGGGIMFGYNTSIGVQDGLGRFTPYTCNLTGTYYNRVLHWSPVRPTGCELPPTNTPQPTSTATLTPTQTQTPPPVPTYPLQCPPPFHGSINGTNYVQIGIHNFTGTPSACVYNPSCPGVSDLVQRRYKAYTFYNPFGSFSFQCVNVRIDTSSCSGNIYSAAYSNFTPNDLCSNYLGGTGGPIVGSGSYEFSVFRGQYLTIVVTEVTPGSGCSDFTVTITSQFQCIVNLTTTPTNTPTNTPTHVITPTFVPSPSTTRTSTPPVATPTQTPTAQTGTSTRTLTATPTPVGTTTATPTACAFTFADVPPGSTFYPYVTCLVCRGIVQGYPDGTYRPGNDITRGQAAKIIANSAGYNDPILPDRQTFVDVPVGSTFWLYIERVALHGAITGYACGGDGEPCPGTYFRPQNSLTRGQSAKIVSITAGYTDTIPQTQQTFSDVPVGSTFWLYIERAALHNLVTGYPDGTYRPQNLVTRGQLAKLAAIAFFPGCE